MNMKAFTIYAYLLVIKIIKIHLKKWWQRSCRPFSKKRFQNSETEDRGPWSQKKVAKGVAALLAGGYARASGSM